MRVRVQDGGSEHLNTKSKEIENRAEKRKRALLVMAQPPVARRNSIVQPLNVNLELVKQKIINAS